MMPINKVIQNQHAIKIPCPPITELPSTSGFFLLGKFIPCKVNSTHQSFNFRPDIKKLASELLPVRVETETAVLATSDIVVSETQAIQRTALAVDATIAEEQALQKTVAMAEKTIVSEEAIALAKGAGTSVLNPILTTPLDNHATKKVVSLLQTADKAAFPTVKGKFFETHYKGLGFTIYTGLPGQIIFFGGIPYCARLSQRITSQPELNEMFTLGFATILQALISNPIATVKTRLQGSNAGNVREVIRDLPDYKTLYRGCLSRIFRDTVFNVVFFPLCDSMKKYIEEDNKNLSVKIKTANTIFSGFTAGVVASFASYPFNTISQLQGFQRERESMHQVVRKVFNKEGVKGFWKGYSTVPFRQGLVGASTNIVVEGIKYGIENYSSSKSDKQENVTSESNTFFDSYVEAINQDMT